MALFGGSRDVSLMRHLNKELINDIINTEVVIYKLAVEHTEINIYGESSSKVFFSPMKVNCIIRRDDKEYSGDFTVDYTKSARFAFLRDELTGKNLLIQEGDIIRWDLEYYEVTTVSSNQLWVGRNPSTLPLTVEDGYDEFGYDVSIIVTAYKTTPDKFNIDNTRPVPQNNYDLTKKM